MTVSHGSPCMAYERSFMALDIIESPTGMSARVVGQNWNVTSWPTGPSRLLRIFM